jgi:peptide/nickel transport system permease protein
MRDLLIQRLIRTVVVLVGLSLVVFVLLSFSGDPARIMAPATATPEDIQNLRTSMGLDKPGYVQYAAYMQHVLMGDFGTSWKYRRPALTLILNRLPATIELAVTAMVAAGVAGVLLGILAAARHGQWPDVLGVGVSVMVRAMPSFWLGLMLILLFAVQLGWLPTSGRGSWKNLIMPAITLAVAFTADILLLVRSGLVEALHEEYVRTARAKGLSERTVFVRHALRNVAIPVLTVMGVTFGRLLGGAVVTETVFSWPGVGSLAVEAVSSRDFPLVQASVFVLALGIVLVNLALDVSYPMLDPRIRRC